MENSLKEKSIVFLLLGGDSLRFNSDRKKQFTLIDDKEVFLYTLDNLYKYGDFDQYYLALSGDDIEYVNNVLLNVSSYKRMIEENRLHLILGGKSRAGSVNLLFEQIKDYSLNSRIYIHDACRVLLDKEILDKIDNSFNCGNEAITVACKCFDSIYNTKENKYVNRDDLLKIQTPQAFRKYVLEKIIDNSDTDRKDEFSISLKLNFKTDIIDGSSLLLKITDNNDFKLVSSVLKLNNIKNKE